MNFLTRRTLLVSGLTAGGFVAVSGWPTIALADLDGNSFRDQLEKIAISPDAIKVRQLMSNFATDPAWVTLAKTFLQNNSSILTGFQQDMLKAIPILTRDPQALAALLSGGPVSFSQKKSLEKVQEDLRENPAVRQLFHTAEYFKKSTMQLSSFVSQILTSSANSLPAPTTLGDPTLDAVIADVANLRRSTAFQNLTTALTPIMQNPKFIKFLKEQPVGVIVGLIPIDVILALMLPSDKDPLLTPVQKGTLEILIAFTVIMVGFISIPFDLAIGATIAAILTIFGGVGGLVLGFDDLFSAIDCDFDGDPSDSADVPGQECPAS